MSNIALAIHGGAGTILRSTMTPELEREYRGGLEDALRAGWDILSKGGSALDAVDATVCSLEDFHLFNAGRGSVFTHDGKNEMDASIMDGKTLDAGAVAFVRNVKNPIKLARLVMEKTPHVLLAAEGANDFAREMNVEFADDAYFFTEHRWEQLQDAIERGSVELDHTAETPRRGEEKSVPGAVAIGALGSTPAKDLSAQAAAADETTKHTKDTKQARNPQSAILNPHSKGTVGAVACDRDGNLAAATSTGGMTNKKFGRVGDTALIGAGTYAENSTCAVSCTGHGEFFMIGVTAYDVAARMKYAGLDLESAAREALARLTEIGGDGGFIAVDAAGNIVLPFNSDGMYRGSQTQDSAQIQIYRD
jgi:beta-aspartyl-peptidase (threonine type)